MKFKELKVGDWFIDASGSYVQNCIFMKMGEEEAFGLNWYNQSNDEFAPNDEVTFVTSFGVRSFEAMLAHVKNECHCPEVHYPRVLDKVNSFADIKEGQFFAITPEEGSTVYRRLKDGNTALIVWTEWDDTNLGTITSFAEDEFESYNYHTFKSLFLTYPEVGLIGEIHDE